jgi:hypothetical protein
MLGASSYHVKPHSMTKLREHLDILHKYWMTCETPEVDASGRQLRTDSNGKLGDRFAQAGGRADQVSAPLRNTADDLKQPEEPKWEDRDAQKQ